MATEVALVNPSWPVIQPAQEAKQTTRRTPPMEITLGEFPPMEILLEVLIIPAQPDKTNREVGEWSEWPPSVLTGWPIRRGKMGPPGGGGAWGVTWESRRSRVSSTEILTEGRHGVPAQSLKLGESGFALIPGQLGPAGWAPQTIPLVTTAGRSLSVVRTQ